MTKYCFPDSLKYYYCGSATSQSEEVNAIQTAVDSLVDALGAKSTDKRKKSELSFAKLANDQVWTTMRQYNSALFRAAQIRCDYIDLLFEVWNRTFGAVGGREIGKEWYDPVHTISEMWTEGYVNLDFYRKGNPEDGGKCDQLSIEERKVGELFLTVTQWKDDDNRTNFDGKFESKLWKIEADPHGERTKWAISKSGIKIMDLAEDFDGALATAVTAAREMIEFLKEN